MRLARSLVLSALLSVLLGAFAVPSFAQSDDYLTPQELKALEDPGVNAAEIKKIQNRPTPTLPELLIDEVRLAGSKVDAYEQVAARTVDPPDMASIQNATNGLVAALAHKPCDDAVARARLADLSASAQQFYQSLYNRPGGMQKLDSSVEALESAQFGQMLNSEKFEHPCTAVAKGSEKEFARLAGVNATHFSTLAAALKANYEAQLPLANKLSAAWKQRQTALEALLQEQKTSNIQSFIAYLPYIVLIFCAFGLSLIAVIRIFDTEVQMEWVVSGQVIQFASVMVLLIIVSSLGLLHILEANSIGTLLGAIGGYVLSQGVGRAAAVAATGGRRRPADPAEGQRRGEGREARRTRRALRRDDRDDLESGG